MRWLVAALLIGGSSVFLYQRYQDMLKPPPPPPAPAPMATQDPPSFLTVEQLKTVRASVDDPDPGVRWTSLQLLFAFKDPASVKALEKAIAEDPDPELRMKAIKLLASTPQPDRVPALVKGVQDPDKDVRVESLRALGAIGDPSASPWVVEALKDPESDVKMEALKTLGRFQEKRKADFKKLADQLRNEYEDAVKRTQKQQDQSQQQGLNSL